MGETGRTRVGGDLEQHRVQATEPQFLPGQVSAQLPVPRWLFPWVCALQCLCKDVFLVWKRRSLLGAPWGPVSWLAADEGGAVPGLALRRAGRTYGCSSMSHVHEKSLRECRRLPGRGDAQGDPHVITKAQLARAVRPGPAFCFSTSHGAASARGLEEPWREVCPVVGMGWVGAWRLGQLE